jgi:hypothetical protein
MPIETIGTTKTVRMNGRKRPDIFEYRKGNAIAAVRKINDRINPNLLFSMILDVKELICITIKAIRARDKATSPLTNFMP